MNRVHVHWPFPSGPVIRLKGPEQNGQWNVLFETALQSGSIGLLAIDMEQQTLIENGDGWPLKGPDLSTAKYFFIAFYKGSITQNF